jgi:hypothetical protein
MTEKKWFASEDLVVRLQTESGSFQGVVVHTEDTGSQARVVVDFPPTRIPTIPVGSEAPLVFSGASLPVDLKASGIVVLRREDFFRHRYMFQISHEAVSTLGKAVSQRNATRVQPLATMPVKVSVTTVETNQRVDPELSDISATGVSVRVPRSDEQKLYSSWRMRVSLLLPDEKKPITLLGNVVYRKLVGQAVQYGIEFDSASPDYEVCQSEIMAYVLRCQAEAFRQALKENPMQPDSQRKPSPAPQGAPDVE